MPPAIDFGKVAISRACAISAAGVHVFCGTVYMNESLMHSISNFRMRSTLDRAVFTDNDKILQKQVQMIISTVLR